MRRISHVGLLGILIVTLFWFSNEVLMEKSSNTYYMLSRDKDNMQNCDVLIFGSCHAYASFNPIYLEENYGIRAYNMSNAGEIIPSTYLRMLEQFKTNRPKVAVVEMWGVNAYETYISTEAIMDRYFKVNIENIPFSKEKLEVINDFDTLDVWEENVPLVKYKGRLLDFSLSELDFNYSFEKAYEMFNADGDNGTLSDMKNRLEHRGYLPNEPVEIMDYEEKQGKIGAEEVVEIEPDILKYIDKIIGICNLYDVELIFYRAPYTSAENELKKANYLGRYLDEKNVDFYDMEKEIEYSYEEDFTDYQHLSVVGAEKTTEFLSQIILKKLK